MGCSTGIVVHDQSRAAQLIVDFLDSDEQWEDEDKRQEIIDSAKKHGDMRQRKMRIADFSYPNIDIFYTEKFNGKLKSRSVISRDNMRVRLYFNGMNKKIEKIKSMKWKRKEK